MKLSKITGYVKTFKDENNKLSLIKEESNKISFCLQRRQVIRKLYNHLD